MIWAAAQPSTSVRFWTMSDAIGLLGIVLALGLLIWLAYRGWSVLLLALWRPLGELALSLTGVDASAAQQWLVAFGSTFALLLPATVAMGTTLPAMERLLARLEGHETAELLAPYGEWAGLAGLYLLTAFKHGLIRVPEHQPVRYRPAFA